MGAKEDSTPFAGTMIGILAQAVVEGELSDIEAMTILTVLIAAGGESTTSLTGARGANPRGTGRPPVSAP